MGRCTIYLFPGEGGPDHPHRAGLTPYLLGALGSVGYQSDSELVVTSIMDGECTGIAGKRTGRASDLLLARLTEPP